nr:immunoglobulin light chain junction region [Macaca mulatta]MOX09543.1 immunoglobulin light chain junction region [Macaca mulatta]
CMQALEYPPTF